MTDIVSVSAYTAGWVMDAVKTPARVPTSIAAREARRMELRQTRGDTDDDEVDGALPVIQPAAMGLDLSVDGERLPQSTMQQAIHSYKENS